jgi:hypothetical protein
METNSKSVMATYITCTNIIIKSKTQNKLSKYGLLLLVKELATNSTNNTIQFGVILRKTES